MWLLTTSIILGQAWLLLLQAQHYILSLVDKLKDFWQIVGVDRHLTEKIIDPSYLDGEAGTFRDLQRILSSAGTSTIAWVGEAGGAYNSGHHLVTDSFVFSFWWAQWYLLLWIIGSLVRIIWGHYNCLLELVGTWISSACRQRTTPRLIAGNRW